MPTTSYCKYCDTAIVWRDRRPLNTDETPHDFACCKAIRREQKAARSRYVAERHYPEAIQILRENAAMAAERGFKQPTNLYARRNQPIVVEIVGGTSKVGWAAEYVGVLASGQKCRVIFSKGDGTCYSSCTVIPFNKTKKFLAAFNDAVAEVDQ